MNMEIFLEYRPLWAVLISLLAAALIMISGKQRNLRESWTILAAVGKILIVFSMIPAVLAGKVFEIEPFYIAQGISLHLKADPAGMLFAVLASFLWLVTSFYSIGYMRKLKESHQTGYFASFAVCLSATMGIAFAGNLLTFFVFYEMLTIATYPLVIHKRTDEAIKAGRKYLAYTLISGQVFLIGIVWAQYSAGTCEFQPGGFLAGAASNGALQIMFILMVLGAAVKAGVMPFHGWLPSAMVAPTPVSALLHAVAVVKAGAFGIVRIVGFVFGPQLLSELGVADVIAWVAAFTIIVASIIAMAQDNLKKRLAFSTIGQLSYVVLGVMLLTPLGMLGGMYHVVAHAVMKITLFFCAGAIYATTHITNISQMNGLGKQMPYTMAAFTVGVLGITGLPFTVGFISKWNLALGALDAGKGIYIAVLICSAMLSATYYLPIVYAAFFKKPDKYLLEHDYGEANLVMLVPLLVTATISIILGVFPNAGVHLYDLAALATESIFKNANLMIGGL
ncbi:MAG: monovalent cation/H+ antiporter subunit D family protein [Clostridia bacterium]|nr:monovalent cation/H+ antiporter subunit D family protein [Clostridia bacterium]MDD4047415.1 monovalent cation/H+ antiporter subunit D family protein [Clostridia bacterium]